MPCEAAGVEEGPIEDPFSNETVTFLFVSAFLFDLSFYFAADFVCLLRNYPLENIGRLFARNLSRVQPLDLHQYETGRRAEGRLLALRGITCSIRAH